MTENDHSDCINIHGNNGNYPPLPDWVRAGCADWGELLKVAEWQDDGGEYRGNNGWKGSDLVHDRNSPVRVLDYYVRYGPGINVARGDDDGTATTVYKNFSRGGVGTTLTGIVHFTRRAESHKGYCHGGSMCSIAVTKKSAWGRTSWLRLRRGWRHVTSRGGRTAWRRRRGGQS